jgi:hypothetical protein
MASPSCSERNRISRRGMLRAGVLGMSGLSLAELLRQRSLAETNSESHSGSMSKDTAVIFLFLHGGPSQLETYDMKPSAPSEVSGPYRPIGTAVPALR